MNALKSNSSTTTPSLTRRLGQLLSEEIIKIILMLLLIQVIVILSHYLVEQFLHFELKDWLISLASVIAFLIITIATGAYLAKMQIVDQLNTTLGSRIVDLDELQSAKVDELNAALKSKVEELDTVLNTCIQLKEIMKGDKDWLVDDEMIFKIESQTDEEILVMVPDFYYEENPKYLEVIVNNLSRENGPRYRYFVPGDSENRAQWKALQRTLSERLIKAGVTDPDERIGSRFKVALLADGSFPDAVLYGLAIYRKKDGTVTCLQYLPREIGTMNINIPFKEQFGHRLVLRNFEFFERLSQDTKLKVTATI